MTAPDPRASAKRAEAALLAPVATPLRRAGVLSVAASLLWPAQAAVLAAAIAALAGASPVALPTGTLIPVAALAFAALAILRAVLDRRAAAILFRAADATVAAARARILSRIAAAGPPQGAAAAAALLTDTAEELRPFILRHRPAMARCIAVPPVLLLLTLPFSWAAALALLIAGPLIPVFMALVGMAAEEASRRRLAEATGMNAMLMERLSALSDIRLLGAAARAEADFTARADGLRDRTMAVLRIAFLSSTVLELFSALGVAMVAVHVGLTLLGLAGFGVWGGLSLFGGLFVLLLAPEFFQPLRDLAAAWHDRAAGRAAAEAIDAFTHAPGDAALGPGAPAAPLPGPFALEVHGARPARGAAATSLTLVPGEAVALTGPSGAGKSALLAALAGLIPLRAGEIRVCGALLSAATADAWRARIALAPQQVHFGEGALADFLDARGTGADPWPALRLARADHIVRRLPEGLAARLGETGGGVSGGEARRLVLARAILGGGDLILADEPTADLDPETAAGIIDAFRALKAEGRTLLVATHDPSLIAAMDRAVAVGEASPGAPCAAPEPVATPVAALLAPAPPAPAPAEPEPAPAEPAPAVAAPMRRALGLLLSAAPGRMARGAFFSVLTLAMGAALLGLSGWFITAAGIAGLAGAGLAFDLFRPSAGVRLLALGRAGARYAERLATHDATLRALATLRVRLLSAAGRGDGRALARLRGETALARITADVDALDALPLRLAIPLAAGAAALALGALAIGLLAAWSVAVSTLLLLGLGGGLVLMRLARRGIDASATAEAQSQALRRGAIALMRDRPALIAFGAAPARLSRLAGIEAAARAAAAALDAEERAAGLAIAALHGLAVAAALGLGAAAMGPDDAPRVAIGLFVALALAEGLHGLRRGAASYGKIRGAACRVLSAMETPSPAAPVEGPRADPAAPALQVSAPGLSIALRPGRTVALKAPSGAGKTTLLLRIAGLLPAEGHDIRLRGAPLAAIPEAQLRDALVLLPQRSALIAGTVRDNLALAGDHSDSAMEAALDAVAMTEVLAPRGGLSALLGEGGAGLSGGETRRLALARAILRDPAVLLLDEPTEGLDAPTAARVLTGLRAALPQAAILAAIHRGGDMPFFEETVSMTS